MLLAINNLSLRKKSLIIFIIPLAALTLVSALAYFSIHTIENSARDFAGSKLIALDNLLQADRDLYQALAAERSLLFVSAKSDRFKELVASHKENIGQSRERMEKFIAAYNDESMKTFIDEYRNHRVSWEQLTLQIVEERAKDTRTGRRTAIDISFGEGRESFQAMRTQLDKMTESLQAVVDSSLADSEALSKDAIQTIITVSIISFVFIVLLNRLIISNLTKATDSLKDSMHEVSEGDGDLTLRIPIVSNDELGETSKAFNTFISHQASIIKNMQKTLGNAVVISQDVTHKMNKAQVINQEQSAHTNTIADAVEAISGSSSDLVHIAESTASETASSRDLCSKNQQVMVETGETMTSMFTDIENTAEVINDLACHTEKISSVMEVINSIAEQTNLLALNAAIEAARAGEQGRGFAVVADEVRSLAQRTQESTQEIADIVNGLQSETDNAVSGIKVSIESSKTMVLKTQETSESLSHLLSSIDRIEKQTHEVVTVTSQQSEELGSINSSVLSFQSQVQQSMNDSAEILSKITELNSGAEQLQTEIVRFKC